MKRRPVATAQHGKDMALNEAEKAASADADELSEVGRSPAGQQQAKSVVGFGRDDFDRDVWCLLGLPVDMADIDQAVGAVLNAARTGKRLSFVTPNVNWLVRSLNNPAARRAILNADMSLIDGAPLVLMAKRLGLPVRTRVAGSDLFEALRRRPAYSGQKLRVFFFGGRDGAAEAAAKALEEEEGALEAAGWLNPGHGDLNSMSRPEIIEEINRAAPDFIVVALGAGKGQDWIERNQPNLDAPVIAHLGAVVDFTACSIARAPELFRNLGLEWAWRIKEEPALWRRYFDDGLGLAKAAIGGLLPQMMSGAPKDGNAAQAVVKKSARGVTVKLSGVLVRSGLAPIRAAFREAAAAGMDVRLDFSNAADFDCAFLGLLLMLEKHVANAGATLFVEGANQRQARKLNINNMRYPQSIPESLTDESRQEISAAMGSVSNFQG